MTIPNVPAGTRYAAYNVTTPTSNFDVPFAIFGDPTDIAVKVAGVLQSVGAYTVVSRSGVPFANIPRPVTDGQVQFVSPVASGLVEIFGLWQPRWSMGSAQGITRDEFNRDMGDLATGEQELRRDTDAGAASLTRAWAVIQSLLAATPIGLLAAFGAIGNGIADDRAAFVAAEATFGNAEIVPSVGTYLVGSSITLNARYPIPRGALLKPAAGVTITFGEGGVSAGDYPIFDLSLGGHIAGLKAVSVDWFTSKGDSGIDCTADVQAAYDACATSAVVRWPGRAYSLNGATAISVTKQQITLGAGVTANGTYIKWLTAARNGFALSGGASISGINFDAANGTIVATSGIALAFTSAAFAKVADIAINAGYDAIKFTDCSGITCARLIISDCVSTGLFALRGNDFFIDDSVISNLAELYTLSGVVGAFLPGEGCTFSDSTPAGSVSAVLSSTQIKLSTIYHRQATVGATVTGSTSGAHGTIASVMDYFEGGNLRLVGNVEAFNMVESDLIGGRFSMTTDTDGTSGPKFNKFTECYFDTSSFGLSINHATLMTFTNCWVASHNNNGATVSNSVAVDFGFCTIANNSLDGLHLDATAANCSASNSQITENGGNGVTLVSGMTSFIASLNNFTAILTSGPTQAYDLSIGVACSGVVAVNNIGRVGKLQNSSTATNNIIGPNVGW